MIKRYILEKVDFNGDTHVISKYRSFYRALNRYNLLNYLKNLFGIKDSSKYRINELPLVHFVFQKHNVTKVIIKVKSFDDYAIAIYHCNMLNKKSDGTVRYYVRCALIEED